MRFWERGPHTELVPEGSHACTCAWAPIRFTLGTYLTLLTNKNYKMISSESLECHAFFIFFCFFLLFSFVFPLWTSLAHPRTHHQEVTFGGQCRTRGCGSAERQSRRLKQGVLFGFELHIKGTSFLQGGCLLRLRLGSCTNPACTRSRCDVLHKVR